MTAEDLKNFTDAPSAPHLIQLEIKKQWCFIYSQNMTNILSIIARQSEEIDLVRETEKQIEFVSKLKNVGLNPEVGMWVDADYGENIEVDILLRHEMIAVETWAEYWRFRKRQKEIPKQKRQKKDLLKTQFLLKNNFMVLWLNEKELQTELQQRYWAGIIYAISKTRMSTTDLPNPLKGRWKI